MSDILKENVLEKSKMKFRNLTFVDSGTVILCGMLEITNTTQNP